MFGAQTLGVRSGIHPTCGREETLEDDSTLPVGHYRQWTEPSKELDHAGA